MLRSAGQRIVPYLWYATEAEEAARFYVSIFPDSRVERVSALPADSHSGPAGSVKMVDFTLWGQSFRAMSAGPYERFNHAISLMVDCQDQAEVDRYWNALLEGGEPQQCGWLKDKYGLFWQITPIRLFEMMLDSDARRARRVAEAMLTMIKLDLPQLEAAYRGA
jgi:predicted 3-demethylubiquinone-9 3-methyltransferase (glyoxalase superfamily)